MAEEQMRRRARRRGTSRKATPRTAGGPQAEPTRRAGRQLPARETRGAGRGTSSRRSARRQPVATPPEQPGTTGTVRIPTQRRDKRRWHLGRTGTIVLAACTALLIGYIAGLVYYSGHFTPGTTVGGVDASSLSPKELGPKIEEHMSAYEDHVSGQGLDFVVRAYDVALSCDGVKYAETALAQTNPSAWPIRLFSHESFEVPAGVSFDRGRLDDLIAGVVATYNGSTEEYEEATIVYDEKRERYVSTSELANAMLNASTVSRMVGDDVAALKEETIIDATALMRPTLDEADERLAQVAERANKILDLDFSLTLDGNELMRIDGELIRDWIVISDDPDSPSVSVSADAITEWSYETLNDLVNGENETRVWEVDSPSTGAALAEHINALDSSPLEVSTITIAERPAETPGARQRGRHIDVNISSQYARLYDDDGTVLWRSYVVTGDPSLDQDTPVGEFQIINMEENATLTGADDDGDGEPDYETHVYYWMCFKGMSYGLHDATWRSEDEFGSDTYATEGSHGCVNLPFDKAAELYGLIRLGDPVVIHY